MLNRNRSIPLVLSPRKRGLHLITHDIEQAIETFPETGLLHVFIQHTSAGLTLNENADPTARHDLQKYLDRLVPEDDPAYVHTLEGSDDMPAHIKSTLVGNDITIPVMQGRLALGTWQGIYLCEFRNHAPSRSLMLTLLSW